uniref:Sirohydrochlorin ferrochelatase n=1 Tax=Oryza nivara TaxID=4536 RepID=A0A0E0G558_ORYNI
MQYTAVLVAVAPRTRKARGSTGHKRQRGTTRSGEAAWWERRCGQVGEGGSASLTPPARSRVATPPLRRQRRRPCEREASLSRRLATPSSLKLGWTTSSFSRHWLLRQNKSSAHPLTRSPLPTTPLPFPRRRTADAVGLTANHGSERAGGANRGAPQLLRAREATHPCAPEALWNSASATALSSPIFNKNHIVVLLGLWRVVYAYYLNPLPTLKCDPYKQTDIMLPRIGLNIGNIVMSAKPNSGFSSETAQGESCTVGEKDGVIIVDHGSRREESNLMLNDFVAMFRARTGYKIVEPAHMELAEPTIKDAFGKCVQQGASRVIVSPYFLSPGRHWKQDIPALAAEASKEHSNITYVVTAPLGLHELMVDVMNDRIKYCLRHVAGNVEECTVCAGTGKCQLYP